MTSQRLCALVLTPVLMLAPACTSTPGRPASTVATPDTGPSEYTLTEDISVRRIAPGVWVHTTLSGPDFGRYPANGLVIEDGAESLLVDTGWSPAQTEHLLTWAKETLRKPVRAAVSTHFHVDRTAGIPVLVARNIPVYGLEDTVKLATEHGRPVPTESFSGARTLGPVELFFPGAGHARDNLLVWHRDSGVLFGGCFVKDGAAKDLGNVEDADLAAWPASLERTRERFPEARVVIPGHGAPGGPELLEHTRSLIP
ncbi:subclass B1 metallo-beta-lactamase [Myxococcus llanfairpwllgwyngyllgogerychwyrndrobwllllantysiliogogogochensis]|uniref:beta-lactamase n=1 Tax=Myxococcus llanfairpwllgwyngyllgogerychwyrndrobwllllantysiliogogogochensis TaxID=2590453 RepID=A0A540WWA3_9BACT|nr:subclass B1 metallo-beta-lactamase [Myxococcus llanfairpwllgwyngyllgogerychwyrndrobwllllantysiliogogogochensis]TQF13281.1 subclass B1 metallo-beta-lactamase [Myxococcus llanfairpwllgwyngyllgogerychwyrndrobwllllantysiliogogogochensis]